MQLRDDGSMKIQSILFNTLPINIGVFMTFRKKPFENTVEKGENAGADAADAFNFIVTKKCRLLKSS